MIIEMNNQVTIIAVRRLRAHFPPPPSSSSSSISFLFFLDNKVGVDTYIQISNHQKRKKKRRRRGKIMRKWNLKRAMASCNIDDVVHPPSLQFSSN